MLLLGLWRWPRLSSPPWTEWVWESESRKERGRLSALYKELVLLMKSPWQMGLILEMSHNHRDLQLAHMHTYTHTHTCFSSLLLSVPLTVYHSLFSLFSLCASLIQPFYPPLCARLLFIERFGWSVQAFRPKNYCHAPPRSPSACPTPPPFIAFSARIRICPHLEQKAFIPGWLPPACSLKKSFICHNPLQ